MIAVSAYFGFVRALRAGVLLFLLLQTAAVAQSPVQLWRQQFFGTTNNSGAAADSANPAGDGLINLLKYATGLNPLVVCTNPVTVDISTGWVRMSLPKNPNAPDVACSVQITTNLTDSSSWTTNGTTIDQNTSTLLTVRASALISTSASRFLRLTLTDLNWTVPGLPQNLQASRGPGGASVTLQWSPPANNGGTPVDTYSISVYGPGLVYSTSTTTTHVALTGLTTANYPSGTLGRSYTFYVAAHNAVGWSTGYASSSAVPYVSYVSDNLRGIWSAKGCLNCHSTGTALAPVLDNQTGNADYNNAVNAGSSIYLVPSGQQPAIPHAIIFSTSSFEYQVLETWVADGHFL